MSEDMKVVKITAHETRVWIAKVEVPSSWGKKEIEEHYLRGKGDPYEFEEDFSDPLDEKWEIKKVEEVKNV